MFRLIVRAVEPRIKNQKASDAAKVCSRKTAKYRAKVSSPEFIENLSQKISKTMADPEFRKRHGAASRAGQEKHKDRLIVKPDVLPKEKVIELYQKGWLLAEIARELGEATRPNGRPRLYRVRNILIKAGVHPRKQALKAKAGQ